jgi:hypothetical protein
MKSFVATLGLLAFVVAVFAVVAAPASAATTIGQTDASANYSCAAEVDVQTGVASGAGFVVPAGSWLLDSWSTFAGGTGGLMTLMIFRPTAATNVYAVIAKSPVQVLRPGVLNTFSANIVVQGGDLLGFWSGAGAACATFTGFPTDLNPYRFGAEPPVGATVTMDFAPGYRLNISATIKSPPELLADLLLAVTGEGPGTSLADKVKLVQAYVAADSHDAACTTLGDFVNELNAQADKRLSAAEVASFTSQANNIKATLGC